jgi:hypothetical protein
LWLPLPIEVEMVCTNIILFVAFCVVAGPSAGSSGMRAVREPVLPDGTVLMAVDGRLTRADTNAPYGSDKWFFEFDSETSVGPATLKAGTKLELLPSATLQHMLDDANRRHPTSLLRAKAPGTDQPASSSADAASSYRLKARVTQYRGVNFLYPTSFLAIGESTPLAAPGDSQPPPERSSAQQDLHKPSIDDSNDAVVIPQDVMDRLRGPKIERKANEQDRRHSPGKPKRDSPLTDRIGFVTAAGPRPRRQWENLGFLLDSLGRKLERDRFRLLPCEALEWAERKQSAEPDRLRFKIAGVATEYKGKKYLLLQRIVRARSHRNFGR